MSDLPPTPGTACATRPRDGPPDRGPGAGSERRVVAVAPEWLAAWESWVMVADSIGSPWLSQRRCSELLRYVRALERERDEAGSFW
jgi:hypothetical protein